MLMLLRSMSTCLASSTLLPTLLAAVPLAATDPEPWGEWSAGGARLAADEVVVHAAGRGYPWIHLDDGRPLRSDVSGATAKAVARLALAEPRSLAAADFDGDGTPDLAAGYAAADGGGLVVLHRGNVDAVYPNAPEARARRAAGNFTDAPFLAPARAFELPAPADFLAAGDFDADGRWDVVAAARGGSELHWLPGDGAGRLGAARSVAAGGRVTALAAGEVNRGDGLLDVAVAVDGDGGPRVRIFAGPSGAMRAAPVSAQLAAPATGLALGPLAGDWPLDVAAVVGDELVIVHGRDRALAPAATGAAALETERIPLGFTALAVAYGDFVQDDGAFGELALYSDAGEVRFLSRGAEKGWRSALSMPILGAKAAGVAPALVPVRLSSLQGQELVVAGAGSGLEVLVPAALTAMKKADRVDALAGPLHLGAASAAVAVLPMRLNRDTLDDLVVLTAGAGEPVVLRTGAVAIHAVTSTGFEDDCFPGDGVCNVNVDSDPTCQGGNRCNLAVGCLSSSCTLRAAVQESNAAPGAQIIQFSVGGGHQTFIRTPSSGPLMPRITDPVTLDGTTQPGFAGTPLIELKAPSFGGAIVTLSADNSVIRGLAINDTLAMAVKIEGGSGVRPDGNLIEGNFLGTDVTGTTTGFAGGAIDYGVWSDRLGADNLIGGTTAAARNLVAGTVRDGILVSGLDGAATGNLVQGNYVGTDVTGTVALGNGRDGIGISGGFAPAGTAVIGGTAPGAGNLIAGNTRHGIYSFTVGAEPLALLQGNLIGTDATGAAALANGDDGVHLQTGSTNTLGGTSPAAANVIAGNGGSGVYLDSTDGDVVRGNFIGTDAAGADLGNGGAGIEIDSHDNVIGGTGPGEANVIAWNGGDGALVLGAGAFVSRRNSIRGNSIHSNGELGIDGWTDGVTPNDPADADNFTNYPVLTSVTATGVSGTVGGTLQSGASASLMLDFYSSAVCDPSGNGEGRTWLGATGVTTDGSGAASFTAAVGGGLSPGEAVTATATDAAGTTGEFSACATAVPDPALIFADGFESGDVSVWSGSAP